MSDGAQRKTRPAIAKNVVILGWVSLFNDLASEMIYPIVPLFLTNILGAPVTVVGLIEGVAEATASILKIFSGWLSDRFRKRKIFVFFGYAFSTISKVLIGLASAWPLVLFARFLDRFGKGVRTSARDALITESTDKTNRGLSFGYHRAMDTLGAVIGPLAAVLLLSLFHDNMRPIFFIAFIPGVIGLILLLFFVREKYSVGPKAAAPKISWKKLDPSFKIFLLISVIFSIGNSSDAFLILRAQNLGLTLIMTILAYVLYNVTYALFSTPAGALSDKIGPKKVFASGLIIFGLVYLAFGLITGSVWLWLLFPVYGCYIAFTDGVGKAYIAGFTKAETSGTVFGAYQTATGLAAFFASLLAGFLWKYVSVSAPFIFGGLMAFVAVILFAVLQKRLQPKIS
jgi:MFS family permease